MWGEATSSLALAGPSARPAGRPLPARYLLLAVALHATLLAVWPRPSTSIVSAVFRLNVLLRDGAVLPVPPPEMPPSPATAPERGVGRPFASRPHPSSRSDQAAAPPSDSVPANDKTPPLAEAALAYARREAARLARDPMAQAFLPRESVNPMARLTTRQAPGEKLLQEGLVQITNPDGSRYCLQRPPAIANRDGPVAVLSMPMNCP